MKSGQSRLIAEVYDLDKPIGDKYSDVAYFTELLKDTPGRMLELAVGTGRILIPLLEGGVNIEGLDHSAEMLNVCRQRCAERGLNPILHQGHMADIPSIGPYDVVVIAAGAIKELDGIDEVMRCLSGVFKCLRPGGKVIIDVVPPRRLDKLGPLRYWAKDECILTLQQVLLDYDGAANRTTELMRYEKWREGTLVDAELHRFCVQHWTLREFVEILTAAGYADISVIADYRTNNLPGKADTDWTFHAVKPDNQAHGLSANAAALD